ncbi:MAG: hypothetical protein ACSI46_18430 [Gloeotrichia echinulata DVL01]|jgi:hypothetical protein|nr:hypothetical protein [Gloeotrichia echinulata DEX184]
MVATAPRAETRTLMIKESGKNNANFVLIENYETEHIPELDAMSDDNPLGVYA